MSEADMEKGADCLQKFLKILKTFGFWQIIYYK